MDLFSAILLAAGGRRTTFGTPFCIPRFIASAWLETRCWPPLMAALATNWRENSGRFTAIAADLARMSPVMDALEITVFERRPKTKSTNMLAGVGAGPVRILTSSIESGLPLIELRSRSTRTNGSQEDRNHTQAASEGRVSVN